MHPLGMRQQVPPHLAFKRAELAVKRPEIVDLFVFRELIARGKCFIAAGARENFTTRRIMIFDMVHQQKIEHKFLVAHFTAKLFILLMIDLVVIKSSVGFVCF